MHDSDRYVVVAIAPAQNVGFGNGLFELSNNAPFAQYDDSMRNLGHFVEIGGRNDDRHAFGSELCDLAQNLATGSDVDTLCRFVEQQHLRVASYEPACQEDLLLVATRKLTDALIVTGRDNAQALDLAVRLIDFLAAMGQWKACMAPELDRKSVV